MLDPSASVSLGGAGLACHASGICVLSELSDDARNINL